MSKILIIATTARSGSELVCSAIQAAGGMGRPREYLNLEAPLPAGADPGAEKTLRGRFEAFSAGQCRSDGVDALKVMWTDFQALLNELGGDCASEWKDACWVYLRRGDKAAQAVSLSRANITGQWHLEHPESAPVDAPYLDFHSQLAELRFIEQQELAWEAFFRKQEIEPVPLWYEDFLVSPDHFIRRLAQALEVEDFRVVPLSELPVRAVGTAQSREWRSLFSICQERGLLLEGGGHQDHFLTTSPALALEAEVVRADEQAAEVAIVVRNQGSVPLDLRRSLWGEPWKVCVGVQWARIDRVFAKAINGAVELPDGLAPGASFRAAITTRRPVGAVHHEAYALCFLRARYAIRLLGGGAVHLPPIAVAAPGS